MTQIANSTFFDMTSYQLVSDALFQQLQSVSPTDTTAIAAIINQGFYASAYGTTVQVQDASTVADASKLYVGVTLNRAQDPTALLSGDWATRQRALADQADVFATYGASPDVFKATKSYLGSIGTVVSDIGYVTSEQSRTIWLELTPDTFKTLFGTPLLQVSVDGASAFYAWAGNLSLDDAIAGNVDGIWVQQGAYPTSPAAVNTNSVILNPSSPVLGEGNGANGTNDKQTIAPSAVGEAYNFPLPPGSTLDTPTIALVEGAIPSDLFTLVNMYRATMGLSAYTPEQFQTLASAKYGASGSDLGEIYLDVSVIADAAPNSSQILYTNNASTYFTSYQQAIFDLINNPAVLSSSYPEIIRFTPDSPFQRAYYELFVDAQLRNISVFLSSGDGGSQSEYGTGVPLIRNTHGVPNAVIVGGSSLVSMASAEGDSTLTQILQQAQQDDPATLFALTAAGLSALPSHLSTNTFQTFTEAVWNVYYLYPQGTWNPADFYNASQLMQPDYAGNEAGTGGVDSTWDTPAYQIDFGLNPTSAGPNPVTGRGSPDVAALAGGDTWYLVLNKNYVPGDAPDKLTAGDGGTSAATPLWGALTAQMDAVFNDQGLPNLGYYNDLLYISAAIAPAAFNDISLGNNVSTFYYYGGEYDLKNPLPDGNNVIYGGSSGDLFSPTGIGYYAAAGYDLTTGLGSPNGVILTRTLLSIGHMQMDGQMAPDVVTATSPISAVSGAAQTLLVQASGDLGAFSLTAGAQSYSGTADGSTLAWTNRLAGQVLQADFDAALVQALDGAAQTQASTLNVKAGDTLSAAMDGTALGLYQTALTSAFGFAAFGGLDAGLTVARPVAVAQTVDGADNQDAVVRIRQNGQDTLSVTFYRVDDLSGTIDGVAPGASAYAALAAARAYHTGEGGTSVAGPGWGAYTQTTLTGVNSGDLIAMRLTDGDHTYWAFAQGNEAVDGENVTHLWSYGLNQWGWEDGYGGGDRDYNDLVVQLDFVSTAGSGLLV